MKFIKNIIIHKTYKNMINEKKKLRRINKRKYILLYKIINNIHEINTNN